MPTGKADGTQGGTTDGTTGALTRSGLEDPLRSW